MRKCGLHDSGGDFCLQSPRNEKKTTAEKGSNQRGEAGAQIPRSLEDRLAIATGRIGRRPPMRVKAANTRIPSDQEKTSLEPRIEGTKVDACAGDRKARVSWGDWREASKAFMGIGREVKENEKKWAEWPINSKRQREGHLRHDHGEWITVGRAS